jgi:hypothetical protein
MRDEAIEIPKPREAAPPCPRCGHIFEVGFTVDGIRFGP